MRLRFLLGQFKLTNQTRTACYLTIATLAIVALTTISIHSINYITGGTYNSAKYKYAMSGSGSTSDSTSSSRTPPRYLEDAEGDDQNDDGKITTTTATPTNPATRSSSSQKMDLTNTASSPIPATPTRASNSISSSAPPSTSPPTCGCSSSPPHDHMAHPPLPEARLHRRRFLQPIAQNVQYETWPAAALCRRHPPGAGQQCRGCECHHQRHCSESCHGIPTKVMLNLADPDSALRWWRLQIDGIDLARYVETMTTNMIRIMRYIALTFIFYKICYCRMEFTVTEHVKAHPMALAHPEKITDPEVKEMIMQLTKSFKTPASVCFIINVLP